MRDYIEKFTYQLNDALHIGRTANVKRSDQTINTIWIAGMGGSGIGANIVQRLTQQSISVPIVVTKGYHAPQFAGRNTLLIACSYSGNTEETLSCLQEGLAKRMQVVCITSGGQMASTAKAKALNIIPMPAGSSSPRAMLGYSMVAQLYTLYHLGLIQNSFIEEIRRAITLLDKKEIEIQEQAMHIAGKLGGQIPWLYGAENIEPVLIRFQNQINENAKQLAHVNVFPEMNHNELEGWRHPNTVLPRLQVVYLHTTPTQKRINQRMQLCRPLFERSSNPVIDLFAEGVSLLEQYCFLIHLTDWISFFLAHENKVDPKPVETITQLKTALLSSSQTKK